MAAPLPTSPFTPLASAAPDRGETQAHHQRLVGIGFEVGVLYPTEVWLDASNRYPPELAAKLEQAGGGSPWKPFIRAAIWTGLAK